MHIVHEVRFFCHFEQISHHETQDRLNDLNATRIVVNATRCTLAPLYHCRFSENIYICFRCTYAAYFLIGVTGVVFFSSITRFSGLWFPSEQRATATGLTITCANMGSLLPALTSPLIVSGNAISRYRKESVKQKAKHLLLLLVCRCGIELGGSTATFQTSVWPQQNVTRAYVTC